MNAERSRAWISGCCLLVVGACSSGSSNGVPAGGTGGGASAGSGGAGTGGRLGSGGTTFGTGGAGNTASAGSGGAGTGGTLGSGGTTFGTGGTGANGNGGSGEGGGTGGSAGLNGSGGSTSGGMGGLGATGHGGQSGTAGETGAGGLNGTAGSTGSAGAGGATATFVCNQAMPLTLTREWFEAGFEQDPGIVNARWQLKAREHGYITEWANPNSDFWNEMIESPCTTGSTNPDHVVLMVLSWDCCTTQAQWTTQINDAIANFKAKYSALKRIDLMTIVRGPGNMRCPAAPTAGETIVVPPELDAALADAATQFPNFVFVAPKFEAANCAAFSGGGPEFTTAGSTAVAKMLSAYFVNLQ
jgi:hypothetical protein